MNELRFRLYVAGEGPRSHRAAESVRRLCAAYGSTASYDLVDVTQDPLAAERARVLMTPTLDLAGSGAERRVIGDLSDLARVIEALGLPPAPSPFLSDTAGGP